MLIAFSQWQAPEILLDLNIDWLDFMTTTSMYFKVLRESRMNSLLGKIAENIVIFVSHEVFFTPDRKLASLKIELICHC